jgi:hypothetical protein
MEALLSHCIHLSSTTAHMDLLNAQHIWPLNHGLLRSVGFLPGTGMSNYHLFNWRGPTIPADRLALIAL